MFCSTNINPRNLRIALDRINRVTAALTTVENGSNDQCHHRFAILSLNTAVCYVSLQSILNEYDLSSANDDLNFDCNKHNNHSKTPLYFELVKASMDCQIISLIFECILLLTVFSILSFRRPYVSLLVIVCA